MQRLAELEHHIIAHVHEIVDRAQADGLQALLHPCRARADLHAGEHDAHVERTILGRLDRDRSQDVGACTLGFTAKLDLGVADVPAKPSSQLARNADVAECVRPVGRDLQVKHGVPAGQGFVDRQTDGEGAVEDEQARMLAAEAQLIGRAHHAVGLLAADLGLLDLEVAGQHGAGQGHRHAVAGVAVGCPAYYRADAAVG